MTGTAQCYPDFLRDGHLTHTVQRLQDPCSRWWMAVITKAVKKLTKHVLMGNQMLPNTPFVYSVGFSPEKFSVKYFWQVSQLSGCRRPLEWGGAQRYTSLSKWSWRVVLLWQGWSFWFDTENRPQLSSRLIEVPQIDFFKSPNVRLRGLTERKWEGDSSCLLRNAAQLLQNVLKPRLSQW